MLAARRVLFTFGLLASLRMLFNQALLVYVAEINKNNSFGNACFSADVVHFWNACFSANVVQLSFACVCGGDK